MEQAVLWPVLVVQVLQIFLSQSMQRFQALGFVLKHKHWGKSSPFPCICRDCLSAFKTNVSHLKLIVKQWFMNLIQLLFPMDLCQMQQVMNYVIFLSSDLKKRKKILKSLINKCRSSDKLAPCHLGQGQQRTEKSLYAQIIMFKTFHE